MAKRKHQDEMIRFANSPEGTKVWYKSDGCWYDIIKPIWVKKLHYIVDDKHAELRKLQHDKPETEFEIKHPQQTEWCYFDGENWELDKDYRVKEEAFKPVLKKRDGDVVCFIDRKKYVLIEQGMRNTAQIFIADYPFDSKYWKDV